MATQVLDLAALAENAARISMMYEDVLHLVTGFQVTNILNRQVGLTVGVALLGAVTFLIDAQTTKMISLPSPISFTRGSRIANAGINLTMGFGTS